MPHVSIDAESFSYGAKEEREVLSGNDYMGGMGSKNWMVKEKLRSWPIPVAARWDRINKPKSVKELGLLSWNTNGRLDLRGCREGLIRSWVRKGFVDIALIQETLKKKGSSLFDMFGQGWWNMSSWAVSDKGRGSGGCTIFGQPSLISKSSFSVEGGRICGTFVGGGLILNVYFPTKGNGMTRASYRAGFSKFVDELIATVDSSIDKVLNN